MMGTKLLLAAAMTAALPQVKAPVQPLAQIMTDSGTKQGDWKKDNYGWWFSCTDGTYPSGEFAEISGTRYYFGTNGYMAEGWVKTGSDWIYCRPGGEVADDGWEMVGSSWYYFGTDGLMYSERFVGEYYLRASGNMAVGWAKTQSGWMYFGSDGRAVKNCWKWLDGSWYYFDTSGRMLENEWKDKYYLTSSGAMATGGWLWVDGNWHYFRNSGECVLNEWLNDGGKWYFFDSSGNMIKGKCTIGSAVYYFNQSGEMVTGWQWVSDGWYYFGSSGAMAKKEWRVIDGSTYYFNDSGRMVTGKQTIDGKSYTFDSSGALLQGWVTKNGVKYYYLENGDPARGWLEISKHWYYFYEGGKMAVSTTVDGYKINPTGIWVQETTDSRGITYVNGILIANKKHSLPSDYAPGEDYTAGVQIRKLISDMRAAGYDISTGYSGYRSYDYQSYLYWNYVSSYGQTSADTFSARPGYSEHQTGLAFDLRNTDGSLVTTYAESNWIAAHAYEYGFIVRYTDEKQSITGYVGEPWHLRYVGNEAEMIYRSGLTLEEYFCVSGGTSY